MTNQMSALFNNGATHSVTGGANQLQKTAQLTSIATDIVNQILATVETNPEEYAARITESQRSHAAMDKLINDCVDLKAIDIEFLKTEAPEELDKMIRSQQSKRSRSKSKLMTLDNYKTLMNGAVAENLLRIAYDKPKNASSVGARAVDLTYTEEDLQLYSTDLEALKRELRNVQSKKSIAKTKADFDETSERWQQLLAAEETLKGIRETLMPTVTSETVKAVETTTNLKQMLAAVENIDGMKSADAKELLKQITAQLNG